MSVGYSIAVVFFGIVFGFIVLLPWVSLLDIGTIAKELTAIRRLMEEQKK